MSSKIGYFIMSGILWTFILSIPVGQGKNIFHLAHYYLVDSRPVNWLAQQFSATVAQTDEAREEASSLSQDVLGRSQESFSKMTDSYQLSE